MSFLWKMEIRNSLQEKALIHLNDNEFNRKRFSESEIACQKINWIFNEIILFHQTSWMLFSLKISIFTMHLTVIQKWPWTYCTDCNSAQFNADWFMATRKPKNKGMSHYLFKTSDKYFDARVNTRVFWFILSHLHINRNKIKII